VCRALYAGRRIYSAGRGFGWGTGWIDLDNDGWLDLFLTNGHVYPEVSQLKTEAGYKQRKVIYRNLGNGRFADISERLGSPVTDPKAGRGSAFGDFDNDGQMDVEDCATLSRTLSEVLEAADPITEEYTLEVSSPGIDRPLTVETDFARFAGHEARVELIHGLDGRRRFKGLIIGLDGRDIVMDVSSERSGRVRSGPCGVCRGDRRVGHRRLPLRVLANLEAKAALFHFEFRQLVLAYEIGLVAPGGP